MIDIKNKVSDEGGWFVETYGGGRYTSVAWYATAAEANLHCTKLRVSGQWSGMPPRITVAPRRTYAR